MLKRAIDLCPALPIFAVAISGAISCVQYGHPGILLSVPTTQGEQKIADVVEQVPGRITFRVDDVKPLDSEHPVVSYDKALALRFGDVYAFGKRDYGLRDPRTFGPVVKTGAMFRQKADFAGNHFMSAVHLAHARHHPLTLSPDMVWMLILQGVSLHIRENSEKLRGVLKIAPGVQDLEVEIPRSAKPDYAKGASLLAEQVRDRSDPEMYDLYTQGFSTTGNVEAIAFKITLLDAMKNYFRYKMFGVCGFPTITLEGTPEDWRAIIRQVQGFRKLDLDWWIDELLPVLEQFEAASRGSADLEFWQSFYKLKGYYVSVGTNGHVLVFFPYLVDGAGKAARSTHFPSKLKDNHDRGDRYVGVGMEQLPGGLSRVKFTYVDVPTRRSTPLEMVAGFVGAQERQTDGGVRPEIGWLVREPDPLPFMNFRVPWGPCDIEKREPEKKGEGRAEKTPRC